MTALSNQPSVAAARATLAKARGLAERDDLAEPILAGMRARAVADACEQLGVPAILIDASGRVLHVGDAARHLLEPQFSVTAGHLVGHSPAVNRDIQDAVMDAVRPATDRAVRGGRRTRVAGLPYRDGLPCQLLAGILVLGRPGRTAGSDASSLRSLLTA